MKGNKLLRQAISDAAYWFTLKEGIGLGVPVSQAVESLGEIPDSIHQEILNPYFESYNRQLKLKYDENNCDEQELSTQRTFLVANPIETMINSYDQYYNQTRQTMAARKVSNNLDTIDEAETTQHELLENRNSRTLRTRSYERIFDRSEWSKATTIDTRHAADLSFDLEIANEGSDVAREISSIIVNVYIGNTDDVAYTVDLLNADQSNIQQINNFFPGSRFRINTPIAIPLSIDETKKIDLGEPIRLIIARIEYGDDQLFYENAYAGGVLFLVDDGVDDEIEDVKSFIVPTWGEETYLASSGIFWGFFIAPDRGLDRHNESRYL